MRMVSMPIFDETWLATNKDGTKLDDLRRSSVTPSNCKWRYSARNVQFGRKAHSACKLVARSAPDLSSAPALCARVAFRQWPPLRIQVLPDLRVASVYIRTKLQATIDIREGGLVPHKYRHRLW